MRRRTLLLLALLAMISCDPLYAAGPALVTGEWLEQEDTDFTTDANGRTGILRNEGFDSHGYYHPGRGSIVWIDGWQNDAGGIYCNSIYSRAVWEYCYEGCTSDGGLAATGDNTIGVIDLFHFTNITCGSSGYCPCDSTDASGDCEADHSVNPSPPDRHPYDQNFLFDDGGTWTFLQYGGAAQPLEIPCGTPFATTNLDDTWLFDFSSAASGWSDASQTVGSPTNDSCSAFNHAGGYGIMRIGGGSGDTERYTRSGGWTTVDTGGASRISCRIAYDPNNQTLVMFAGGPSDGSAAIDVWDDTNSEWDAVTELNSSGGACTPGTDCPDDRRFPYWTYDHVLQRFVAIGGRQRTDGGTVWGDVWSFEFDEGSLTQGRWYAHTPGGDTFPATAYPAGDYDQGNNVHVVQTSKNGTQDTQIFLLRLQDKPPVVQRGIALKGGALSR